MKKREKGVALIYVVLLIVMISSMGFSIVMAGVSETKLSIMDRNRIEAKYIADSAVDSIVSWLVNENNNASSIVNKTSGYTNFGTGKVKVEVIGDLNESELIVEGTAIVNGVEVSSRALVEVSNYTGALFQYDMFSTAAIDLKGNVEVVGDVSSAGTIDTGGSAHINGTRFPNMNIEYPSPVFPTDPKTASNWTSANILNFSSGEIKTYNAFVLNSDLTINTGSGTQPVVLVVNTFNSNNKRIVVNGSAQLHIFIWGSGAFSDTNAKRNNGNNYTFGDASKLIVFLNDGATFSFNGGNDAFSGFLYGPKASFTATGTNQFKGAINVNRLGGNGTTNMIKDVNARNTVNNSTGLPFISLKRGVVLE